MSMPVWLYNRDGANPAGQAPSQGAGVQQPQAGQPVVASSGAGPGLAHQMSNHNPHYSSYVNAGNGLIAAHPGGPALPQNNIDYTSGRYNYGRRDTQSSEPSLSISSAQPQALKRKLSISSFSVPLKVIVGKNKVEFYIQKGIICNESDFIKAACSENWESGRSNTITLEEDNPTTFSIFLTWLMTKSIDDATDLIIVPEANHDESGNIEASAVARYNQLLDCYFFGDMLQSKNFQNAIMSSIVSLCAAFHYTADLVSTSTPQLVRVFKHTWPSSALRKFVLDYFVTCVDINKWLGANAGSKELHDPDLGFFEALIGLAVSLARNTRWDKYSDEDAPTLLKPWKKHPSAYHDIPAAEQPNLLGHLLAYHQ